MSSLVMQRSVHNARFHVKSKRTPISCNLHTMEFDDRPEPAKRLERARKARGFATAKEAAVFFSWNYDTYAQHENGTRGLSRAAETYAKAFRVSAAWLLTGEGRGPGAENDAPAGLRRIKVAAHIQAGYWAETWEWEEDAQYPVYIPDDPEYRPYRLYGAETRGPSMNKRYPEKTVLVFTDIQETQEQPIAGKRYIVERRRASGEAEHTVKLLHVDEEGKYWLLPESDDPRFQAAISIDDGIDDGDTVVIVGRVCYAVSKE
ncbi:S24 family peptidase [Rhizobium sp. CNPSo 4039]|uniref:S24 family peptidase n=1 Tax=Rhizobium sp. CNPSo 4039 TaxID=3021409 RepID=UPI0025516E52|nr:S24 family peptidase [Rhizobium sp. CNPSo 4039]MDK4713014.1 S24 family peptidase [Rhizobium sp. CNPSo 4039]